MPVSHKRWPMWEATFTMSVNHCTYRRLPPCLTATLEVWRLCLVVCWHLGPGLSTDTESDSTQSHPLFWMLRVFPFNLIGTFSLKAKYGAIIAIDKQIHRSGFWGLWVSTNSRAPRLFKGAGSTRVGSGGGSLAIGPSHGLVVCPATTFLGGEFRNDTPEALSWFLSWVEEKLCESAYSLWSGSSGAWQSILFPIPPGVHGEWNVSL